MFEFSFHSRVQNQKLIIYLMFLFCSFFFLLVWGKVICIEKKTNVSCALSMTGMHFLLMDVENKMYMIQQCKVFYVAKKIMYNFLYDTSSGILIRF